MLANMLPDSAWGIDGLTVHGSACVTSPRDSCCITSLLVSLACFVIASVADEVASISPLLAIDRAIVICGPPVTRVRLGLHLGGRSILYLHLVL